MFIGIGRCSECSANLKIAVTAFPSGKKHEANYQVFDVRKQSEQTVDYPWVRPTVPLDSMMITHYNIQKDYYDYIVSKKNATSTYYDPFFTPESIKSNVAGGVGIFTYYTFDRVVIVAQE